MFEIKKEELRLNDAALGNGYRDNLYFDLPKERGEEIFKGLGEQCMNENGKEDNSYKLFEVCCAFSGLVLDEVLLYPMYEDKDGNFSAGDFIYLENGEFAECEEFIVEQMKEVRQRGGLPV